MDIRIRADAAHGYCALSSLITRDLFVPVDAGEGYDAHLKIEGLNPAGSIKLKTALSLIEDAEARGLLRPGGALIESSSGNLGIAVSMAAASYGYRFTCVVDPNTPRESVKLMKTFGAEVVEVDERDENGGYLEARIETVKKRLAQDNALIWLNQYANPANPAAHYAQTAREILARFPEPDYLVIGAGTTGTLTGCAQLVKDLKLSTRIVAVEPVGSITFGGAPAKRRIPGLGTSRRPEICRPELVDHVIWVEEEAAITTCREIARGMGLLIGGSTGTVIAGARRFLREAGVRRADGEAGTVVILSPDNGDRYLNTVYDDDWVATEFPDLAPS